ncbi:hypothetical protein GCM10027594_19690 [Hymenobacter agri]
MKNRIRARYPHASSGDCISEHTAKKIHVYDHPTEKRCRVRPLDEVINPETDFTILNRSGRAFHLIAVDKCLLQDTDKVRRCDCVVYNPRVVCFIELKGPKKKNLADHIKSGAEQLRKSIAWFEEEAFVGPADEIEAIVSPGAHRIVPNLNSSIIKRSDELAEALPNLTVVLKVDNFKKLP